MKLLNILISCVLVIGLATSCGSTKKAKTSKSETKDAGFVSIFDGKTIPVGEGMTNLLFLQ